MSKIKIPEEAFKRKLLDKDFHERLIQDLPQVVATAGVPASAVWMRLSTCCSKVEMLWVKNMRSLDDCGLLFVGNNFQVPVETKMVAITGVCLRNYTDARVMPVQDVVKRIKDDSMPTPTILLIPNFCLDKANGGDVPSWEISNLMGLLLSRMGKGLKTILYASSMAVLQKQYGDSFKALLETKFSIASPDDISYPQGIKQLEMEV